MLEVKKIHGRKAATVSIEVSLTAIMGTIILLFVLALFGSNIKMLADASNFANLFKDNNKKTFQDEMKYKDNDPTKTQIHVQLVGEQGLNYYISSAQATIDKYKLNPPESEAQIEDLAKAATIAELFDKLSDTDASSFYNQYGISINEGLGFVSVDNKKLSYDDVNSATEEEQLIIAKKIVSDDFI